MDAPDQELEAISQFHATELFDLSKAQWIVLAFDSKDWSTLSRLRDCETETTEKNYLTLLLNYVIANKDRINKLYACSKNVSNAVLVDDGEAISEELKGLDHIDRQSLFAFRIVCAQQSHSTSSLKEYFQKNFKTDWLRKRFLYPLVYHAINSPNDDYLDTFLSYVVTGDENEMEHATIKFLLRDDVANEYSLSFKAYIALLCHPFDACEILIDHLESELALKINIDSDLIEQIATLKGIIKAPRLSSIFKLLAGQKFPVNSTIAAPMVNTDYGFDDDVVRFVGKFLQTSKSIKIDDENLPKPLAALCRMRMRKYPLVKDFDYIVPSARKWRFTEAGRLINALLRSLYMVPRCKQETELRDLMRLVLYTEQILPFIMASPSGLYALSKSLIAGNPEKGIVAICDEQILASGEYNDRFWIKAVHWSLQQCEMQFKLADWLAIVKRDIRVAPSFLTGIDWEWIDNIIRSVRLKPFMGNTAGVYALLLMQIEEPNRDSTVVRVAFEPFAQGLTLSELVTWLFETYAEESTAFVRYLLTPEVILIMRLAPNEMAAIAGRVLALRNCVKRYGFSPILSNEIYEQESKALTTALLLKNVNAGQFEIPWGMFRRDVVAKQGDLFEAFYILQTGEETKSILSHEKISTPIRFRNGKIVQYTFRNSSWPLAHLILTIVEDFLQHPSFGLEVLLSTRFRHDTLGREYRRMLQGVRDQSIYSVTLPTQIQLIDQMSGGLASDVAEWLDRRMHSARPEKPDGMFDLVPSQDELNLLVSNLEKSNEFEKIIDGVCSWLKGKLNSQLVQSQIHFREELGKGLCESIHERKREILDRNIFRPGDVERVATALTTAISRETENLVGWFKGSDGESRYPLMLGELKLAVDGLYENEIASGNFKASLPSSTISEQVIEPDKVRLCFDLLSEVFNNTLKHCGGKRARVVMREFSEGSKKGVIFSNLAPLSEPTTKEVSGERYNTETEAIFREGSSGLVKIASLSATMIGTDTKVLVVRKKRSFHLLVQLWAEE